jgi:hypothetical protein
LLPFCIPCQDEEAATSAPAPLQLIISFHPFERVQINPIDHCLTPDNGYNWIFHAKDHFSKVTALYPLNNREALTVAIAFCNWIMAYVLPKMVQCDNGTEFQGLFFHTTLFPTIS